MPSSICTRPPATHLTVKIFRVQEQDDQNTTHETVKIVYFQHFYVSLSQKFVK